MAAARADEQQAARESIIAENDGSVASARRRSVNVSASATFALLAP